MLMKWCCPSLLQYLQVQTRDETQRTLAEGEEIISIDNKTGAREEFILTYRILIKENKTVFIIESKKNSFGEAMKQCLLSLKDAGDVNGGGVANGFVTIVEDD